MATALGIPFMQITSVPLRINMLSLKNAFVTPQALIKKISQHLYFQVLSPCVLTPSRGAHSSVQPA